MLILTQDKCYLSEELPSSLSLCHYCERAELIPWTFNDIYTTCLVITFEAVRKFNPSSPEFEICDLMRDNSMKTHVSSLDNPVSSIFYFCM